MERKKILRSDFYLVEEQREDEQQWRKEEETEREKRQEGFICFKWVFLVFILIPAQNR
jgi:hypothetical protein